MRTVLCLALLTLTCFAIAGCDLTLGPKVATNYIIIHPGKPLQVLSKEVVVKGRLLDGEGAAVDQNIAGWVCFPLDHWRAIERALEAKTVPK